MLHLGLPAYKVLLSFLQLLMAQKHSIEWSIVVDKLEPIAVL